MKFSNLGEKISSIGRRFEQLIAISIGPHGKLQNSTQHHYYGPMMHSQALQNDFKFTSPESLEALHERKEQYQTLFHQSYDPFRKKIAKRNLKSTNSWEILHEHTTWMDEWIKFTWGIAYEEKGFLVQEMIRSGSKQLNHLRPNLEKHKNLKISLEQMLFPPKGTEVLMESAERAYYTKQYKEIDSKILELNKEVTDLEETLPILGKIVYNQKELLQGFCLFARGGYGRSELSFSSDIDLGYCLNYPQVSKLQRRILQELIKRVEELFQNIPLDIASQYFELGEDLSRFANVSTFHTIPSILESRSLLGSGQVLDQLKEEILIIVPHDKIIRHFLKRLQSFKPSANDEFEIKGGYGGLRHLQIPLWLMLILLGRKDGSSKEWLQEAQKRNWISAIELQKAIDSLEFYFDLRNFLGLSDCYKEHLEEIGYAKLTHHPPNQKKDYWNDHFCLAYLKLKERFISVDFLDRFRLFSIHEIASIADKIFWGTLNRNEIVNLGKFQAIRYLQDGKIIQFKIPNTPRSEPFTGREKISNSSTSLDNLEINFFLDFPNLFALFTYIARTGSELHPKIQQAFSSLIPQIYDLDLPQDTEAIRDFIFQIFYHEYASVALEQMIEISSSLNQQGEVQTLLGRFIPEVNRMRFLVRNVNIHQWPLCIHSLKTVAQLEVEINQMKKKEPELWNLISENDLFALKWSTFFHDIGKIDPYRDHESYGPLLSTQMLTRIGCKEKGILNLSRLLVGEHQSVVRFSHLSTHEDIALAKFFELANRDPRKVILLYLINLSDFKSVNEQMYLKAGRLEALFEESLKILSHFKGIYSNTSMIDIVNDYLRQKKKELKTSVLLDLLIQECKNKPLEQTVIEPLQNFAPEEAEKIEKRKKDLYRSLHFLSLGELDTKSLESHSLRIRQSFKQNLSTESVKHLVKGPSKDLDWLFSSFPNRYLLISTPALLASQLFDFSDYRSSPLNLSITQEKRGSWRTLSFHFFDDFSLQEKIILALSQREINIESGKINSIRYSDGRVGYAGFFQISNFKDTSGTFSINLKKEILHSHLPQLKQCPAPQMEEHSIVMEEDQQLQIQLYEELKKGYLVIENSEGSYHRTPVKCFALKTTLLDAPFSLFKIIRLFEHYQIQPQQITVTTIGKQIVDYFYFSLRSVGEISSEKIKEDILKFLNSEVSWQYLPEEESKRVEIQ